MAGGVFLIARLREPAPPPTPSAATLPANPRVFLPGLAGEELRIPVGSRGEANYRVKMQAGDTLVYAWSVDKGTVLYAGPERSYDRGVARQAHGTLVAPLEGNYGWFWQNRTADALVIHFKIKGRYEPLRGPFANN